MYTLTLCLLACIAVTVNAEVGAICTTWQDCNVDECCQIVSDFPVYSKRQAFGPVPNLVEKTGTCQLYETEGQKCNWFSVMNGYSCGCAPGLDCYSRQEPVAKRAMLMPNPGYQWVATCEISGDQPSF